MAAAASLGLTSCHVAIRRDWHEGRCREPEQITGSFVVAAHHTEESTTNGGRGKPLTNCAAQKVRIGPASSAIVQSCRTLITTSSEKMTRENL